MKVIVPNFLGKLFGGSDFIKAEIRPECIHITSKKCSQIIPFSELKQVKLQSGLFWRSLQIYDASQAQTFLKGISKRNTQHLDDFILKEKENFHHVLLLLNDSTSRINELAKWVDHRLQGTFWVSNCELSELGETLNSLNPILRIPAKFLTQESELETAIETLQRVKSDSTSFRLKSNECFVQAELARFKTFFDTIESNPLTDAQRLAIITHEDNTRVIAGAGSGKTSVIVAKAGYLLKKGLCSSDQLLLIAFNRSAANEIEDRIKKRIGTEVRATTFHALGLGIIGEATGEKPSLAKSAEDKRKLLEDIHRIITYLLEDKRTSKAVRSYFQSYLVPYKSESDFENLGDYYEYLNKQDLRTIKGEKVKSLEEIEIANFLFLNGVNYEYEKQYEVDTATESFRQYEPDFFLPDYDIYIEHFGINRDGSTAPYIDCEKYKEGMEWKRNLHAEHETVLIETFSYMKKEGKLSSGLEKLLLDQGVQIAPMSSEQIKEALTNGNYLTPFTDLIATFLGHFKGNGFSIEEVRDRASKLDMMSPRLDAFLKVFDPLFQHYEKDLEDNKVIDFNDMIIQAAELAKSNTYVSPYSCILVDEFQDISAGRAKLVSALANQKPSHRLFCVGDDWQAIYRFAGSDIALMRNFESHFGFTETIYLDRTFRFNDRIEKVATQFILRNPAQIPKTIHPLRNESKARITIHFPEINEVDLLMSAMQRISLEKKSASILLLGRYNFLEDGLPWSNIAQIYPELSVSFKTVHSAKGSEADYVVVLGITKGKYGFPTEIVDDPILDSVLSEPENYEYAEERRLFYVAITRARNAVHLISSTHTTSPFLSELIDDEENVEVIGLPTRPPVKCSTCKTGDMTLRTGQYGNFYGCSNYPLCTFRANACPSCGIGYLVLKKGVYECNGSTCTHTERQCPNCKTGRLVERQGKYGAFLGCTNYSSGTCRYTEEIGSQADS